MLAAKFFDDVYYSNAFYARVGGVKTREINVLETHFLSLINYQLFVSPQEYDQYRKQVVQACQTGDQVPPAPAPAAAGTSQSNRRGSSDCVSTGTGGASPGAKAAGSETAPSRSSPRSRPAPAPGSQTAAASTAPAPERQQHGARHPSRFRSDQYPEW
eukprot:GHVN01003155.1.p1 GENE.GHVN01003155.1~~GHVN01003155.1.p1  ORF type:complete len:158 (+),score=2.00 GHVN01003155.1:500-973(+)